MSEKVVGFFGSDDPDNHPVLGRYYNTPFFDDRDFWKDARKIFTPQERQRISQKLVNPFKPDVLFFADNSQEARSCFSILLTHDISTRVFPVDDYIQLPSIGWVSFDILISGEEKISEWVAYYREFKRSIRGAFSKKSIIDQKPDPILKSINSKVRLVQIDRAIQDMAAIQNPDSA